MATTKPTDNQFYRGLNRRFDRRMKFLHRLGFRYQIIAQPLDPRSTYGVVTRQRHNRVQVIPAATILTATPRVWIDMVLRQNLR
jgi:hypothetical protein